MCVDEGKAIRASTRLFEGLLLRPQNSFKTHEAHVVVASASPCLDDVKVPHANSATQAFTW